MQGGSHVGFNLHNNSAGANPEPQNSVEGILQDYEQLRRSLECMQIDKSITFVKDRQGIKREDQRHYNVIAKCAGFAEIIAKLMSNVDPDQISEHTLNNIFLCASAQLAYLRERKCQLIHQGIVWPKSQRATEPIQVYLPEENQNSEIITGSPGDNHCTTREIPTISSVGRRSVTDDQITVKIKIKTKISGKQASDNIQILMDIQKQNLEIYKIISSIGDK